MRPEEIQVYKMKVGDKEYRGLISPTEIGINTATDKIKVLYEFIAIEVVNYVDDLSLANGNTLYYKTRKFPIIDWSNITNCSLDSLELASGN